MPCNDLQVLKKLAFKFNEMNDRSMRPEDEDASPLAQIQKLMLHSDPVVQRAALDAMQVALQHTATHCNTHTAAHTGTRTLQLALQCALQHIFDPVVQRTALDAMGWLRLVGSLKL